MSAATFIFTLWSLFSQLTMSPFFFALVCFYLAVQVSDSLDDGELARRIQQGDHSAFKHFFDRYHAALVSYLRRRGLSAEVTEDLVQNAFVAIWERRSEIDPSKSLRAFLFRIGYTRALNHFRDHAKFDRESDLEIKPAASKTNEAAEFNIVHERLLKVIDTLPTRRKAVFELCFLEDMTYRETAEMLGVSIKTVENQMAFALKTIRAAMLEFKE